MKEAKYPGRIVPDLLVEMERNLAEHACHLHRHMPGPTVTETDDLLIADSGLADDTFDIVAAARLRTDTAHTRIRETVQALAGTGRRFSWWVGPASAPAQLASLLEQAGRTASETETGMWTELNAAPFRPHVEGLDIRPVTNPGQLADYATFLAANWDPLPPLPVSAAPDAESGAQQRHELGGAVPVSMVA